MLRDPEEIAEGGMVWLYPQTKQASTNVHRQLVVRVLKDPKAHWPMVVVGWKEDGIDKWELVHRDNIRKRSPSTTTKAEKTQGDTIGDGPALRKGGANRVRVMPGKKPVVSDEQLELW